MPLVIADKVEVTVKDVWHMVGPYIRSMVVAGMVCNDAVLVIDDKVGDDRHVDVMVMSWMATDVLEHEIG